MDPDACWLTLNELYCPVTFDPPHTLLRPVHLSGMNRARNEYTHNAARLLDGFGERALDDGDGRRDQKIGDV